MNVAVVILLLTLLLLGAGGLEYARHRRHLARIRIRIHVNGTRGKSSVTRLIAAALREAGIVTCAKTTGTLARMILPDGSEYSIFRPSAPNIIEQLRIIRTAVQFGCEALVLECMALNPLLQSLSETKLVKATHGVITNARADHLDVMGPEVEDVALAMGATIPVGGQLFTGEKENLTVLKEISAERQSTVIAVTPEDEKRVLPEVMEKFSYVEHPDNVALALKVCESLQIERETALRGMLRATPDPGALTVIRVNFFGRRLTFVNGFAANDPESSEWVWDYAAHKFENIERKILIINCRLDRVERTRQLALAVANWRAADHIIVIGDGTFHFARIAARAGIDSLKVTPLEAVEVGEIFERIVTIAGRSALLVGLGNIGGHGLELVRYFKNRSEIATDEVRVG